MAKNKKKQTVTVVATPIQPPPPVVVASKPVVEPVVVVTAAASAIPNMPAATESMAPKTKQVLSHADIAQRAYEVFRRRAGAPGSAFEDWCQAERELRQSQPLGR